MLVGTLPDMQLGSFQIDVLPTKATQLGCSQASENRCENKWTPFPGSGADNALNLVGGRNVDADL
jgi:hypothetical protein